MNPSLGAKRNKSHEARARRRAAISLSPPTNINPTDFKTKKIQVFCQRECEMGRRREETKKF
uniref:Uncharacterized protein n=1 Tax=Romanomermis culicivorax TaxID=13658 RepID=A0A915KWU4_ROMCU